MSIDLINGVYLGHTVVLDIAIPLAILMGYRHIYLSGCEMNYSGHSTHFYGTSQSARVAAGEISRSEWIDIVNDGYAIAVSTARANGASIVNIGDKGFLREVPHEPTFRCL
jgi:hypothetical protein